MSSTPADTSPPAVDGRDLTDEEIFASHEDGKLSIAPTVPLEAIVTCPSRTRPASRRSAGRSPTTPR